MERDEQGPMTDESVEQELREYAQQQARELGLERDHYVEQVFSNNHFVASQRAHTKLWVSGLSLAHDQLVSRALNGLGYDVGVLDVPDSTALQFGKEFGNRAQCNPTYFTVGNLVKHLVHLRDVEGLTNEQIITGHAFLTAGACGPCRFGMYATEYRKVLRDAGFEGFRVLMFQQQGGLKQATGEEHGLKIDRHFAVAIVSAILAGDVINLVGYRLRPYETTEGATDRALIECKRVVGDALENGKSVLVALYRCRQILAKIDYDRTQVKPIVSVIGEFWAMTTEGDGNYDLYKFLESQGAECDIQPVVNWLLYLLWEQRHDTKMRMTLKADDGGRKGLEGKNTTLKMLGVSVGDVAIRAMFQAFANAVGLERWELPDMDHVAELAGRHYDTNLRGGEGHMEVGKLLHFVEDKMNHMTISVKPFGCMPSSGVSDGVQSRVLGQYPDAIFLPIETTGDGKVNVQSRVQMMLFKARQKAREEYETALRVRGMDEPTFKAKIAKSKFSKNPFSRPKRKVAGIAANLAYGI